MLEVGRYKKNEGKRKRETEEEEGKGAGAREGRIWEVAIIQGRKREEVSRKGGRRKTKCEAKRKIG